MRESCKAISAPRDGQEGCSEARDQCPVGLCGVGYGETCYRYQATLDGENALVADWLLNSQMLGLWNERPNTVIGGIPPTQLLQAG